MIRFFTLLLHSVTALVVFSWGMTASQAQEVREVTLKHAGVALIADLVVPDGESLSGGVVLLIHGTLAHKDMELIETLQTAFAERGVASLAPTLSHGIDRRRAMYDCANPHRYLYSDALDEIGVWMDWLEREGTGPVTLMGHSRGGHQTARYAVERDGRLLRNVVLLAPAMGRAPDVIEDNYWQRHGAKLAPLLEQAERLVAAGKGAEIMTVPGFIYCKDAEVAAASFASNYAYDDSRDTAKLVSKIEAPVLVIAGSADEVVPDVAARMKPLVDAVKMRLEVIEDADHFFLDFYAEDVVDLVVGLSVE